MALSREDIYRGLDPASPGVGSIPITPSDAAVLTPPIRSLYCATAGDVKFTGIDGTVDIWPVPANFIIPVAMSLVWATGTTATGLHGVR